MRDTLSKRLPLTMEANAMLIAMGRRRFLVGFRALAALPIVVALAGGAQGAIVTPNTGTNSVSVHEVTADGDAAPRAALAGAATGINQPFGVALDTVHREIFVTNIVLKSVSVFALSANGDVAPLRTIVGSSTQLQGPIGIAYDPVNDEIVVRNFNATPNSIVTFARTASGNATPLRVLGGPLTQIDPEAVDLDVDPVNNELFVSSRDTDGLNAILVFSRLATGDVAPIRKIQGAATNLTQPYGIVVDTINDEVLVCDSATASRVLVFPRTANGDVAPIRQIDPSSAIVNLGGIDINHLRDEIVVASQATSLLAVFSRTADGMTVPLRTVRGISTGLSSPALLAIDAQTVFSDGFE